MYQIPNIDKLSEHRIFIYDTNILCGYLCKYSTLVAKGIVCIVLIKLHRVGSNLCMILYNAYICKLIFMFDSRHLIIIDNIFI